MPTWTAPAVDRPDPPAVADERAALAGWLDYQRATLLTKCAGLDAEQLRRRAVPPSTLSLLGLVRHMAEVERIWFRRRVGGEDVPFLYWRVSFDEDFDEVDDADPAAAFETYRGEVEVARAVAAGPDLDRVVTFTAADATSHTRDVRWVMVHMIEEYARHNGHADLLRERIDGRTGD